MDYRAFDRVRGQVGPLELDLVESYAKGILPRREFVRRATVIGLSVPFISAIISACGSDDDGGGSAGTSGGTGTSPAATGAGTPGGTIKVASQKPAGPLDPVAMQDLGTYGIIAQCFEFLCTLGDDDIAPGLAESWSPNEDGTVWTFNLRQGVKWQDGSDFTSADVAATMDRLVAAGNSGLKGVIEAARWTRPIPTWLSSPGRPQRQLPVPGLGLQRESVITPASYESGTTLDGTPTEPARSSWTGSTPPPGPPSSATTPGGVARRRWTARSGCSSTTWAPWSPRRPPARPTPSCSSRSSAVTPSSTTATSTCWPSRRPPTARSGCAATPASSRTSGSVRRSLSPSTGSR